ncbi:hypothetical protein RRG08_004339 [Elysia crispata]|uniref:Uncharacterized protein n=1 Tax=Elysia crispata TaxID=231223 RepID=A0AAE1E791_9GAST|nr:hypothetical protein RRG08_004339 [Elysia crispata]
MFVTLFPHIWPVNPVSSDVTHLPSHLGRTPQLFTVYIKEVVVNDRQVLVTDTPRLAPVLAVAVVSGSAVAGSIYQTRPALGEISAGCDRPGQKAMRQQPTAADS